MSEVPPDWHDRLSKKSSRVQKNNRCMLHQRPRSPENVPASSSPPGDPEYFHWDYWDCTTRVYGHLVLHYLIYPQISVRSFQDRKSTRLNSSHVAISYAG